MKTTIQVSEKLRDRLKLIALCKKITYEELLNDFTEKEIKKLNITTAAKTIERHNNRSKK